MITTEYLKQLGLELGGTIEFGHKEGSYKIIAAKKTDNRGHYRTSYPFVIALDGEGWVTLESVDLSTFKPPIKDEL